MTLKFKTLQFAKMPKNYSFPNEKERAMMVQGLQLLFDQIISHSYQFKDLRKNLLSILYRFLCENAKQINQPKPAERQEAQQPTNEQRPATPDNAQS